MNAKWRRRLEPCGNICVGLTRKHDLSVGGNQHPTSRLALATVNRFDRYLRVELVENGHADLPKQVRLVPIGVSLPKKGSQLGSLDVNCISRSQSSGLARYQEHRSDPVEWPRAIGIASPGASGVASHDRKSIAPTQSTGLTRQEEHRERPVE